MPVMQHTTLTLTLLLLAAQFAGCGRTEVLSGNASSGSRGDPVEINHGLERIFSKISDDKPGEAVAILMSTDPSELIGNSGISLLEMSESDFSELEREQKTSTQKELMQLVKRFMSLKRAVVAEAAAARANGDSVKADEYISQINQLGTELQSSEFTSFIRLAGDSLALASENE